MSHESPIDVPLSDIAHDRGGDAMAPGAQCVNSRQGGDARRTRKAIALVPLGREARATLPTNEAAAHLARAPQTLRVWAMSEGGPIQPIRVNGRLAWPVVELRRLLGVA
jgi:hypothetical protein